MIMNKKIIHEKIILKNIIGAQQIHLNQKKKKIVLSKDYIF